MQRITQEVSTTDPTGALSADNKLLGNYLGDIIREQNGDSALELVEKVRATAKERRKSGNQSDPALTESLMNTIEKLDLDSKRILIKAFSNYFQLINIAEDQQRIRVLRQREMSGALDESIDPAIVALKDAGLT